MKKRIIGLISLVCVISVWLFNSGNVSKAQERPEEPDNLYARSAVLMDADSGRILFGKEEDEKRPMASTTKIMTCILALENMEENQIAAVSDYAASQPKVRLGVHGKEEYYIRDLLYSLMLESHNDSAVVIAEGIGGSVEAFAELMNEKAKELGCINTHFVTPNGLDGADTEGIHETTAAELARIMKYCIMYSEKKEEFLVITQAPSYQFTDVSGKRSFSCYNHNSFLTMMDGALSGKTGFTADAGYCYVGALSQGGRTFIVALLACGWPNHKTYKWEDTKKLMTYGLANYEYRDVWEDIGKVTVPVKDGISVEDHYDRNVVVKADVASREKELRLLLRKDEKVEIKTEIEKSVPAPVKKGQKVGTVSYYLDGEKIKSFDIVTREEAQRCSIAWCFREVMGVFLMA